MRPALAVCALFIMWAPFEAAGQQQEGDAALGVVRSLFDAMRAQDEETLRAVFHDQARLMTAATDRAGAAVLRTLPIQTFIDQVSQSAASLDERLWDEEVRVSGNLAAVWTKYALYVDGVFSHCGVDAFQLGLTEVGWRILQVADTRQVEGCDVPDHVKPGG